MFICLLNLEEVTILKDNQGNQNISPGNIGILVLVDVDIFSKNDPTAKLGNGRLLVIAVSLYVSVESDNCYGGINNIQISSK